MITSGTVSFEDGKKANEEYAPARKATVVLNFDVEQGSSHELMLDLACKSAMTKVGEMLKGALKPSTASAAMTAPYGDSKTYTVDPYNEAAAAAAAKAAISVAFAPATAAEKPKTRTKKAEPLPAVETFSDPLEGAIEGVKAGSKASSEALFPDDVSDDPVPQKIDLSDKGLYDEVQKIKARINRPAEMVAIVAKYCPKDGVPASLRRVPMDLREDCINELHAFEASITSKK